MGLTYADLKLTNRFDGRSVSVTALVDGGALFMCVPEAIALQLGFDVTEVRRVPVTLADGSIKKVPVIDPILIEFENRQYSTEALVLGDEPLMGCIPMEAMDLVLRPRDQKLVVNPDHPNFPVFHAK